jgi:type II secretory pathway component PulJ
MTQIQRTRRGTTLVEVLVAAALSILGMWLLTWSYQLVVDSWRHGNAQAELTAQERMVTTLITRDIQSPRFTDQDDKQNRGRKVSDQRLDQAFLYPDPNNAGQFLVGGYTPPRGGYFRAGSFPVDGVNNHLEANADGYDTSRSTNHFLQMTVLLPGGASHQQFCAELLTNPPQQYYGTAAEVLYYLSPAGFAPNGTTPLFDLYRWQGLVARTSDDAPAYNAAISAAAAATPADNVREVMVLTSNNRMGTLRDLTIPVGFFDINGGTPSCRRSPGFPLGSGGVPSARFGADKLMSNVLSFEVKFTGPQVNLGTGAWPSDPTATQWPRPFSVNSDYPYDNLPFSGVFDTFSTQAFLPAAPPTRPQPVYWNSSQNLARVNNQNGVMLPIRLTGVQIRLRAFDPKTRETRQTTLILDL